MTKLWRFDVPGLVFDPDPKKHEYRFEGRLVPSVTTILGEVLGNFWKSREAQAAMMRGRAVHLATQYFDEGRLDVKSVHPIIAPFLQAYIQWLGDARPEILGIEQPVYSPAFDYAGTLDRVVRIGGVVGVLDLKSGSVPIHTGPQLSGYFHAIPPEYPTPEKRWSLLLRDDGTYKMDRYEKASDWDAFKAALIIHKWKEDRK